MKVLYDYSAFVMQSNGGVSRVLYELFRHVGEQPEAECRLFAGFHRNRYLRDAPKEVKRLIVGWHFPEWIVKQRIFMPINRFLFRFYAKWFRPDVCHYTYFDIPKVPKGCKTVITIHDMIHELFPEMFDRNNPQHRWKQNAVRRAHGIICVSENTKKDLESFFDTSNKKVTVIHHGNSLATVAPGRVDCELSYLLYVGNRTAEYKNFDCVLEGIAKCRNAVDTHLVCFGGGCFNKGEMKRIMQLGLDERTHQTGGTDKLLVGYYSKALALVYPSKYEGFGLPPIEAMGSGCPVISSSAPPMHEIIGNAGLFFDPDDVESLSNQILKIFDEEKRKELIHKGKRRAKQFTWARAADKAVGFYKSLF